VTHMFTHHSLLILIVKILLLDVVVVLINTTISSSNIKKTHFLRITSHSPHSTAPWLLRKLYAFGAVKSRIK